MNYRIGLIGCGNISVSHIHALQQTENAELRCVCDIRPERMERAAAGTDAGMESDWRRLIRRDDIDAVHICTPHYLHAQMAIEALRAGKHVLCEKPMAISAAEARLMAETARETGRKLTICYQNRHNSANLRMREIILSGEAGRLLGGRAVMTWNRDEAYYRSDAWRGRWETEGGALLINQAIHTVDLVRWIAGPFDQVACTLSAKRLGSVIECEDTADMLLTRGDGSRFLIYASNCAAVNLPVELVMECERQRLTMTGSRLEVEDKETGRRWTEDTEHTAPAVGKQVWGSGHARLIPDFYDRLSRGEDPWITPEDALQTAELMDRIYGERQVVR